MFNGFEFYLLMLNIRELEKVHRKWIKKVSFFRCQKIEVHTYEGSKKFRKIHIMG